MSDSHICPQCLSTNRTDVCHEKDCPGFGAFVHPASKHSAGAELITQERLRQISVEGWTPKHDDQHAAGQLTRAAQGYLTYAMFQMLGMEPPPCFIPKGWPWTREWWKPSPDPVRNLEKAGALTAAEIDRLKRKGAKAE